MAKIDEVRTSLFQAMLAERSLVRQHDNLGKQIESARQQADGLQNQLAALEALEQEQRKAAAAAAQKAASESTAAGPASTMDAGG